MKRQREDRREYFRLYKLRLAKVPGQGKGGNQKSRTHCPRGHAYTPENTYVKPSTRWRICRQCQHDRRDRARPREVVETPPPKVSKAPKPQKVPKTVVRVPKAAAGPCHRCHKPMPVGNWALFCGTCLYTFS